MTAQKNISLLAPYFDDHFPRKPVLPLTLLLEGNLELAHFFLQNRTDSTQYFRAVSLHKVRIKQFIFPGDAIVTTVHLKETLPQGFLLSAKTQVSDKVVCSFEVVFRAGSSHRD